jgi:hypothetical protein
MNYINLQLIKDKKSLSELLINRLNKVDHLNADILNEFIGIKELKEQIEYYKRIE